MTVGGRQKRVTFPHKLFMDYLAAWYLCNAEQNIQRSLRVAFKKWHDVRKHEQVVRACCGLMKGREEVIKYIVLLFLKRLAGEQWYDDYRNLRQEEYGILSSLQAECGKINPYFAVYPSNGRPLSQMLNSAKLVVINELTGGNYDPTLPCNADIVLDLIPGLKLTALAKSGDIKTLKKHKDHIIAMYIILVDQDVMEYMSTLLPSSSLGTLQITIGHMTREVVNSLAQMPNLMSLELVPSKPEEKSLAVHGDVLVAAIQAWNGNSKLMMLDISMSLLPASMCRPLLVAIAANCPLLMQLAMSFNALSGCLAGFLENPPPLLSKLVLDNTKLLREDLESLTAVITAGKLNHLQILDIHSNELSEDTVIPLLHALLNTLGDRRI